MDLNWYQILIYGLISAITDILPVSAQAHRLLLLKFFGVGSEPGLLRLLIHVGILAALYYSCQTQIVRILRARSLARIPKKKRKRPLDTKSLMDLSLWKTMLLPVIVAFCFYEKAAQMNNNLIWAATFLFVNGVILYIPQYLPGSNKDSRSLSRLEGLAIGLGGAVSVLPGFSAVGTAASIGSICGVEPKYCMDMVLLMNIGVTVARIVTDILGIIASGIAGLTFVTVLFYILAMLLAFVVTFLAIKLIRHMAANTNLSWFSYYCWGLALFTFILNLMA